jgi:hypothetical protein
MGDDDDDYYPSFLAPTVQRLFNDDVRAKSSTQPATHGTGMGSGVDNPLHPKRVALENRDGGGAGPSASRAPQVSFSSEADETDGTASLGHHRRGSGRRNSDGGGRVSEGRGGRGRVSRESEETVAALAALLQPLMVGLEQMRSELAAEIAFVRKEVDVVRKMQNERGGTL